MRDMERSTLDTEPHCFSCDGLLPLCFRFLFVLVLHFARDGRLPVFGSRSFSCFYVVLLFSSCC